MSEHKAGRELDALVAEKIMGYERSNESWYDEEGVEGTTLREVGEVAAQAYGWGDEVDWSDALIWEIPSYSTDIAAAWVVVEKISEQGWGMELADYRNEKRGEGPAWSCELSRTGDHRYGNASTAPLAICRAALRAIGRAEDAARLRASSP